jgi:UDP-N-acetylmuramate: L-alanyl-gamma-D-glutamyl-meso-diaminopimelate ligase
MDEADIACVYYSHHTIEHKKLEPISEKEVKTAFQNEKLHVFTSSEELQAFLKAEDYNNAVLLLMSSGNFDGVNLLEFAHEVSPN